MGVSPRPYISSAGPAHGIPEKYLEKGRDGDAYLSLTIGKARALARSAG